MARTLKTSGALDLRFQSFGQYLVLGKGQKTKHGQFWVCQCACNQQAEIHEAALVEGRAKSCGCDFRDSLARIRPMQYLTGRQCGPWLVGDPLYHKKKLYWQCQCSCGHVQIYRAYSLLREHPIQCRMCVSHARSIHIHQWYGDFFVLRDAGIHPQGHRQFVCRCRLCGEESVVTGTNLKTGRTQGCRCRKKSTRQRGTLLHQMVGKLYVLRLAPCDPNDNRRRYECICTCREKTMCIIKQHDLLSGNTKSCGCLHKETAREHMRSLRAQQQTAANLDWTLDILRRHVAVPPEERAPQLMASHEG